MSRFASRPLRQVFALIGRVLVWALVLAHVGLLWQRIASQTLFEPLALVRWAASLALMVGLLHARRRGSATPRGLAMFWLIAALLHVQLGNVDAFGDHQAIFAGATSLVWFLPVSVPLAAACALLLALVIGLATSGRSIRLVECEGLPRRASTRLDFPPIAPRPPPVLLAS